MIALVTDSTAYLTREDAQALGVRVIPQTYTVNGKRFPEQFSGENGPYASFLTNRSISTEQCSVAAFSAAFRELSEKGFDVLCLVLSSKLSGAFSSAQKAAQSLSSGKIQVVDSETTAGALRFLLKKARELSFSGLSLQEVANACKEARCRVGVTFSVKSLDPLRRSGRLSLVRRSVSTILNLRPVLYLKNGAVNSLGTARGGRDLIHRLLDSVPAGVKALTVHHSGDVSAVDGLLAGLRQKFPRVPLVIRELGPVLGIHIGTETIAVAWEE